MENFVIVAVLLIPFCLGMTVCVVISDYVLPRCPLLQHFLERVFDVDLERDFDD